MFRRVLLTILLAFVSITTATAASAAINETIHFHSSFRVENLSFVPATCNKALPGFYTLVGESSGVIHLTAQGVNEDNDPIAPHFVVRGVSDMTLIPNDPAMPAYTARAMSVGVTFSAAEGVSDGDFHGVYYTATTIIREKFFGSDGSSFVGVVRAHFTIAPDGETSVSHVLQECAF